MFVRSAGMTTLVRLPGDGCRYFVRRCCLLEERVNPGLRTEFACTFLADLEARFDAFVSLSEVFGLSAEEAGRIWERRWGGVLSASWNCPDFVPGPEGVEDEGCDNLLDGLCLLAMPPCPGRCRHYAVHAADESESRSKR